MAKVILPLGSFSASGQIGRAFVYFPWKGIKCVREYVIPANPNTAGQQTQRAFFTTAVDGYHATGYSADDLTAWRKKAGQSSTPLTYFNQVVKDTINTLVEGDEWFAIHATVVSIVGTTFFTVTVDVSADHTAVCYWGVNPGYMPNTQTGTWGAGTISFALTGLPVGTWIFFYVKNTEAGYGGNTGIYAQKTNAT